MDHHADFQKGSLVVNRQYRLRQVWERILGELVSLQDQAPLEQYGHVVNPISERVYYRDTAFAARAFATEHALTGGGEWRQRAEACISALLRINLFSGLEEPIWNRYGWHWKKGSIPATAMLLDCLWAAMEQLGMKPNVNESDHRLLEYLERCMIRPGLFAHDAIPVGARPVAVQNTTAMALLLMEYMLKEGAGSDGERRKIEEYVRKARAFLYRGQRGDGVWPYVYPNMVQRAGFEFRPLRYLAMQSQLLRRIILKTGDESILLVDGIHNGYVLYFILKSLLIRGHVMQVDWEIVSRGWQAVRRRLIRHADGAVRYDFSEEPRPQTPRYCSFFSTTVYFLALAILAMLEKLGLAVSDREDLGDGILVHIECNLLEAPGTSPCIRPNEGPEEFTRNILPHVGESVAFKGACLSEWVLHEAQVNRVPPCPCGR